MKKETSIGQRVGILGYGEIGQAIAKFYTRPLVKDLTRDDGLKGVDILHVCIPYSKDFIKIIHREIASLQPKLTIIHSTIVPGTTKKLADAFSGMVVHSPARGVHPNLYEGIKTFVKYIGADVEQTGLIAKKHLDGLGITTKLFVPSVTTEVGKLLDTTYYGLAIAWHGEMKKLCDKLGVNFEDAVTDFNTTYNEGYKKLGKHHVVRPVLSAPDGHIGGHCVVPNAKLLSQHMNSKVIDLVLDYQKKVKGA
ncbi:MAG: hypothetical protein A3C50_03620 [Candidatus Staskawiczbacteria bacterium RIFCSPHIGHO2_02_FULL_43_16]|uniref:UDP-glucose/GDP-mannose dehydrogenase dimerisation domain-containing protein n=1 Tax=Candidatus Staskawiczbacteria bacterium RIFCSPHIGHO2_01_FULL_41_41 TaxID=1802203 RepID=A0A1G2HS85_9BACT|nr:MAG: hypothetical protein A2822_02725 [Candidatus Staskawiczbacteria bacterium RIFCSPHIGHO2_01_FULL_41_41]OGZ68025.1 MAG: hypothetical protein A3C50_03620 [Candidatus Staskawiczbacteria bacterium RIFCSPHIGHO2_02_FULL_43_16]OGZ74591.1 MAG: hypothetical protein A3A12_02420 [Candidatus Staskawiczbacteria bacterium RIFCSPLOWO2_01_FULL_43_17b]